MKRVEVPIHNYLLRYEVEGEVEYGQNVVLIENDENLIARTSWKLDGYRVADFLDSCDCHELKVGVRRLFFELLDSQGMGQLLPDQLENYHRNFKDDGLHRSVTERLRSGFRFDKLPVDLKLIERRVSEICETEVTALHPVKEMQVFFIRIVRPHTQNDNNPPHRDVWLDRLRHAVNVYIPLVGSNVLSSLPLAPGSHWWRESDIERTCSGARINGVSFQVPAFTGAKRPLQMVRPNPGGNEILVFSPYLIHGGGINLNDNLTRMSIEMRFWKTEID